MHTGLEALVGIASHPTLSCWLREVIIGLDIHQVDSNHMLGVSQARQIAGHVGHHTLLSTGAARDLLTEAFSKLTNLQTIGLRDYDGAGRLRDGDSARWRSYGWSFRSDELDRTGSWWYRRPQSSPESIFPLLLSALGGANARPKHLEVFLRQRAKLTPSSFELVHGVHTSPIVPVLSSLTQLMLTVAYNGDHDVVSPISPIDSAASLKRLLHHTVNLKTLRINFDPEQDMAEGLIAWLGEPHDFTLASASANHPTVGIVPPVALNLTGLDLGMMNISGPTLVKAIARFNLKSLNLWKVSLRCQDDAEVVRHPDRWSCFLTALSGALSKPDRLSDVLIGYPSQTYYNVSHHRRDLSLPIFFLPEAKSQEQAESPPTVQRNIAGKHKVTSFLLLHAQVPISPTMLTHIRSNKPNTVHPASRCTIANAKWS